MKNLKNFLAIGSVAVFGGFLATGCGPSQEEARLRALDAGREKAEQLYANTCKADSGDKAAKLAAQMGVTMKSVGIDPEKSPLQTANCVAQAYRAQGERALAALGKTHNDVRGAQKLADEVRECYKGAIQAITPKLALHLILEVNRNKKEVAAGAKRTHGRKSS